jgi:N-methylhydantoinase B
MSSRMLDEYLMVTEQNQIQCSKCSHPFCDASDNYKNYAIVKEADFREIGLAQVEQSFYIDRKVVFRQFFCPGCATNIENDVVFADAPSLDDKRII